MVKGVPNFPIHEVFVHKDGTQSIIVWPSIKAPITVYKKTLKGKNGPKAT